MAELRSAAPVLNKRREEFCRKYVELRNGTRAAVAAGYAESGARTEGSRLLANADIRNRIKEIETEWFNNSDITLEQIINELKSIAFQDLVEDVFASASEEQQASLPFTDIFIQNLRKLPKKTTRAIESIERAKDGIKITQHSKMQALKLLSELGGFVSVKNEVSLGLSGGNGELTARWGGGEAAVIEGSEAPFIPGGEGGEAAVMPAAQENERPVGAGCARPSAAPSSENG